MSGQISEVRSKLSRKEINSTARYNNLAQEPTQLNSRMQNIKNELMKKHEIFKKHINNILMQYKDELSEGLYRDITDPSNTSAQMIYTVSLAKWNKRIDESMDKSLNELRNYLEELIRDLSSTTKDESRKKELKTLEEKIASEINEIFTSKKSDV